MSYEFPNGRSLPSEAFKQTRVTGDRVRRAVNDTGKYLVGAAIVLPDAGTFADAVGVHRGSLYRNDFGGYEGVIRLSTGLTVMSNPGLIILEADTSVTPLTDIPTE